MEGYDPTTARQVWQRVMAGREPEDLVGALPAMAAEAETCAALLERLTGNPKSGGEAPEMRRQADCLRGIYRVCTGARLPAVPAGPVRGNREALGRLCCASLLRCREQYARWQDHREYGCVFSLMARQCVRLSMELLARLGKNNTLA